MARAQSIKVSRERLIARLRERIEEEGEQRQRLFMEARVEQIERAEENMREAQAERDRLLAMAEPEDARGAYWARPFLRSSDLAKQVRLLELSDEETISVGPTSDLFAWL